jgi:hypothetical protein
VHPMGTIPAAVPRLPPPRLHSPTAQTGFGIGSSCSRQEGPAAASPPPPAPLLIRSPPTPRLGYHPPVGTGGSRWRS